MLEYPREEVVASLRTEFGYSDDHARTLVTEVAGALHN